MPSRESRGLVVSRLASSGEVVSGRFAVRDLPRLASACESEEGSVGYEFVVNREASHAVASGRIEASLQVRCERCLSPLALALEPTFDVALVEEEPSSMKAADPEAFVCTDGRLDVAAMIEDEVLLAMPGWSSHAPGACEAIEAPAGELPEAGEHDGTHRPFAALEALREAQKDS